jgi:hypothetical protein
MVWTTFWGTFSQTHLVTLDTKMVCTIKILVALEQVHFRCPAKKVGETHLAKSPLVSTLTKVIYFLEAI